MPLENRIPLVSINQGCPPRNFCLELLAPEDDEDGNPVERNNFTLAYCFVTGGCVPFVLELPPIDTTGLIHAFRQPAAAPFELLYQDKLDSGIFLTLFGSPDGARPTDADLITQGFNTSNTVETTQTWAQEPGDVFRSTQSLSGLASHTLVQDFLITSATSAQVLISSISGSFDSTLLYENGALTHSQGMNYVVDLADNKTHSIIIVTERTTTQVNTLGNFTVYLDGILIHTGTTTANFNGEFRAHASTAFSYIGSIDIWDKALTPAEVANMYTGTIRRNPCP